MIPVLATHASSQFNEELWRAVRQIGTDVITVFGDRLVALVLGGGYGRGEGAVWREGSRELPYNDLDFVLVVRRSGRSDKRLLWAISQQHTKRLGVDVDFSRPLTIAALRSLPHYMMWHDLVQGHHTVAGPAEILTSNVPAYVASSPPATEGLRLLLNRGAGLLMAMRVAAGVDKEHDADFVRRNLHKAYLALGDSLLVTHGQYLPLCRERETRLQQLPQPATLPMSNIVGRYRTALQFKLEPASLPLDQPSIGELRNAGELLIRVLLYTETLRTGVHFASAEHYVQWKSPREPQFTSTPERFRNLVRNLRLRKISSIAPRERLYRELPLLLQPDRFAPREWVSRSAVFLAEWQQVN